MNKTNGGCNKNRNKAEEICNSIGIKQREAAITIGTAYHSEGGCNHKRNKTDKVCHHNRKKNRGSLQ